MPQTNQPRCAQTAAWLTAVLRGRTSVDHALDALIGPHETVTVEGLPGVVGEVSLTATLGELRRLGVTGLVYVPALPGDVSGLPGPPAFNAFAVAHGGAVVAVDGAALGLLPEVTSPNGPEEHPVAVRWAAHDVARCATPPDRSVSEAERLLLNELNTSLDLLARLDVAQWRDGANDLAVGWHSGVSGDFPPGLPERAQQLIVRSDRMAQALALAAHDDGASVSSSEVAARRQALAALERATTVAGVTAWNAGLAPSPR